MERTTLSPPFFPLVLVVLTYLILILILIISLSLKSTKSVDTCINA